MKAANLGAYFNVLPPGFDNVAMHIGQIGGNRFDGVLPGDGDFTLRIYLVRSAARRNEAADYTLDIELAGVALAPLPAAQDALLPGTHYHASTTVPCALPYEPDTKLCKVFVIRRGHEGTATVEVRGAKSYLRRILFVKNEPVASDAAQPMTHTRQGIAYGYSSTEMNGSRWSRRCSPAGDANAPDPVCPVFSPVLDPPALPRGQCDKAKYREKAACPTRTDQLAPSHLPVGACYGP